MPKSDGKNSALPEENKNTGGTTKNTADNPTENNAENTADNQDPALTAPLSPIGSEAENAVLENTAENDNIPLEDENEFSLKGEESYVQLRLSVTASSGKRENVVSFIKSSLGSRLLYNADTETVLASPKEEYDKILNTIIECPYTENVLYKNENYYAVARDMLSNTDDYGRVSADTARTVENIERFCRSVIIVVR